MPQEVQHSSSIADQLSAMEGLISTDEIKGMATQLKVEPLLVSESQQQTHQSPSATKAAESAVVDTNIQKTDNSQTSSISPATENQGGENKEKTETTNDVVVESPIFGGKHNLNKKAEAKVDDAVLSKLDPEALKEYLKPLGIDAPEKLHDVVKTWRTDSQKLPEVVEKLNQHEQLYNAMPDDILEQIVAWGKGEDYVALRNSRPNIDFTQDIEKVNKQSLVDTYLPNKFSKEEWEEYNDKDGSQAVKKAIDLAFDQAKEKFTSDKNKYVTKRADMVKEQKVKQDLYVNSAKSSVSSLTKALPDVSQEYVAQTEKDLLSGAVKSLFFKEDGTFTEDAALRLAMAKDGFNLLQQTMLQASRRAETEANESILSRSAENVRNRGSVDTGKSDQKVNNYLNQVMPSSKKQTY